MSYDMNMSTYPLYYTVNLPLAHDYRVHYTRAMKNITFSADERLIEEAREEARRRKTTLNVLFRDWLAELAARDERKRKIDRLMDQMNQYNAGGPYSRDEMNRY